MDFGYRRGPQDWKSSGTRTVITASGSPNTKGSYTEIIASLGHEANALLVSAHPFTASGQRHLVDIAIGAGGSEEIIIENLLVDAAHTGVIGNQLTLLEFPITVPAGTRLSARCQCSTASGTCGVQLHTYAGGFLAQAGFQVVDTYGPNTGDSGGITIDPGSSANTKGAWSELSASCNQIELLIAMIGNNQNSARVSANWYVDIGIGAAGSEAVIVPDLYMLSNTTSDGINPQSFQIPVSIPEGSRIAVRAQCNITDATDRLFDIALYGVR